MQRRERRGSRRLEGGKAVRKTRQRGLFATPNRRKDEPVQLLLPKISNDALRSFRVLVAVVSADPVLVAPIVLHVYSIWAKLGIVEEDVEGELEDLWGWVGWRCWNWRMRESLEMGTRDEE